MPISSRLILGLALTLTISSLAAGCGGGTTQESAPVATGQSAVASVDPATAGGITGKVVLEGTAPRNALINKMDADPKAPAPTTD